MTRDVRTSRALDHTMLPRLLAEPRRSEADRRADFALMADTSARPRVIGAKGQSLFLLHSGTGATSVGGSINHEYNVKNFEARRVSEKDLE